MNIGRFHQSFRTRQIAMRGKRSGDGSTTYQLLAFWDSIIQTELLTEKTLMTPLYSPQSRQALLIRSSPSPRWLYLDLALINVESTARATAVDGGRGYFQTESDVFDQR
jgi:hypothetical protein